MFLSQCNISLGVLFFVFALFCLGFGNDVARTEFGVRLRRQTTTSNIVELLVVVDKALYDKFLASNGGNVAAALNEITEYVAGLVKEVNERLATLGSSPGVSAKLINVQVLTTVTESYATENSKLSTTQVNGVQALNAFRSQANALEPDNQHDFAYLLTGYDVRRQDGTDADLQTYPNSICSSFKQAVVEDFRNERTALAMAKALGFSLGAEADGTGSATACTGQFVMAPTFNVPPSPFDSQPFTFSSCTASAIQPKLQGTSTNCLRTTNVPNAVNYAARAAVDLGQTYNADRQCAMRYGTGYTFCREAYGAPPTSSFKTGLCRELVCKEPAPSSICPRPGTLPFDGTLCGNQQWCQDGLCVYNASAPVVSDVCPQGDQPGAGCSASLCSTSPVYRLYLCCATCGQTIAPVSVFGGTAKSVSIFVGAGPVSVFGAPGPIGPLGVSVVGAAVTPPKMVSVAGVGPAVSFHQQEVVGRNNRGV